MNIHLNTYTYAEMHIAITAIYLSIYKDEIMNDKDNNTLLYCYRSVVGEAVRSMFVTINFNIQYAY